MIVVDLDRRAVLQSINIVSVVTADMLHWQTPCADWNVGQLLRHMISEHRGFASAARGNVSDASAWDECPLSAEPGADYAAAATDVIAAFASAPSAHFWLPKVGQGEHMYPARRAMSFHLLDYVIHGWDVAAAVGSSREIDPELVAATVGVARVEVPDTPARHQPRASFGPPLPMDGGDLMVDRLLATLGRASGWQAQPGG